jgi:hypothetical protein
MISYNRWVVQDVPGIAALEKLSRLRGYPQGWAYGDGDTFSWATVRLVEQILQAGQAAGLTRMNVFPRRDGGIIASFYRGDDVFDFTVFADGSLEWLHERRGQEIACEPITANQVSDKFTEIVRTAWASSGYLGLVTITNPNWVDSKALPSLSPAQITPSPRSTWIAPEQLQARRVGI